jgi:hypothetical protein
MHWMHPETADWGMKALTHYLFAKQTWNPEIDVDKTLAEYYDGRYGPASKQMREFYSNLRHAMSNQNVVRFNLRNRLTDNKDVNNLFQEKHMQYKPTHYDPSTTSGLVYDDGPDWLEMMDLMKKCRGQLDAVKTMNLPDTIRARVAEDEGVFIYADYSYKLFDAVIRTQLAMNDNKMDEARAAYKEALVYADYLKQDTESTRYGSMHSGAPNAYIATGLDKAIKRMGNQLGI